MHETCNLYFAISVIADIIIFTFMVIFFTKMYKNKIIITENNREIYEHDKVIRELQNKVSELEK